MTGTAASHQQTSHQWSQSVAGLSPGTLRYQKRSAASQVARTAPPVTSGVVL